MNLRGYETEKKGVDKKSVTSVLFFPFFSFCLFFSSSLLFPKNHYEDRARDRERVREKKSIK